MGAAITLCPAEPPTAERLRLKKGKELAWHDPAHLAIRESDAIGS